jgi:hypothetical protein
MLVTPLVTVMEVCLLLIFSRSALNRSRFAVLVDKWAALIRWALCSVYVLYTEAVRNTLFSLQFCHGVVDSCQGCKYELTLFRLNPYDEQCSLAEMGSSPWGFIPRRPYMEVLSAPIRFYTSPTPTVHKLDVRSATEAPCSNILE